MIICTDNRGHDWNYTRKGVYYYYVRVLLRAQCIEEKLITICFRDDPVLGRHRKQKTKRKIVFCQITRTTETKWLSAKVFESAETGQLASSLKIGRNRTMISKTFPILIRYHLKGSYI